jgi:DNA-binding transcriptional MerR regulator
MRELKSYSIDELEELTGFDRRTVSYYISEGLLPKVGRRGPKTRYGQEFIDRLKFIQRVKDLQDAGKLPSATLSDIATILDSLSADDIGAVMKSQRRLQEMFAASMAQLEASPPDMLKSESDSTVMQSPESVDDDADLVSMSTGLFGGISQSVEPDYDIESMESSTPLSALESHPARGIDRSIETQQLNELVGQYAELRELAEHSMRSDQSVLEHLPRLLDMVKEQGEQLRRLTHEVRELREQLQEERAEALMLLKKRGAVKPRPPLYSKRGKFTDSASGGVSRRMEMASADPRQGYDSNEKQPKIPKTPKPLGLQQRAQRFAKQQGLPIKDLRTARLRESVEDPARAYWEFRLGLADIKQRESLTLMCEGRPSHPEDGEFVALEVPTWFLATPLLPLFKNAKGKPLRLRLSAGDSNTFELLELPDIKLDQFKTG